MGILEAFRTRFPIDSRLLSLGEFSKPDFEANRDLEMVVSEALQTGLLADSNLLSMERKGQDIPGAVDISVDVIA